MNTIIALAGPKGSGKSTIADWLIANHGYTQLSLADRLKVIAKNLFPVLTDEDLHGPSSVRERAFSVAERRACSTAVNAALTYIRLDPEGRASMKDLFQAKLDITGFGNPSPDVIDSRALAAAFSLAFEPAEEAFKSPRTLLQRLGTEWGRKVWDEVWLDAVRRTVAANPAKRYVVADCRFPNEADYLKTKLGAEVWWVEAGARIQRRATDTHASEPTRDRLIGFCKGEILNTTDVKDLPARLATIFTSP
jgi:hypothetical protein